MKITSGDRWDNWYGRLTHGAPLAVLIVILAVISYKLIPVLELIAIAMLVILGALVGFVWLFMAPRALAEIQSLVNSNAAGSLNSLTALSQRLHDIVSFFPDISSLSGRLKSFVNQELGSLPGLLMDLGSIGIDTIAVLFLTIYFSISPDSLVNSGLWLVPKQHRARVKEVIQCLKVRLRGWILGTGIAMFAVGTGVGTGLWLIGVPLPITFGILGGLLELVPYVGRIVVALLPGLVALTISPYNALFVIILFLIVDQLGAPVIQPLVMGHQVRLHPVVVLAVPAAVFVAVLLDETILKNEDSTEKRNAGRARAVEEPIQK